MKTARFYTKPRSRIEIANFLETVLAMLPLRFVPPPSAGSFSSSLIGQK